MGALSTLLLFYKKWILKTTILSIALFINKKVMKYIKRFSKVSDYETFKGGGGVYNPQYITYR